MAGLLDVLMPNDCIGTPVDLLSLVFLTLDELSIFRVSTSESYLLLSADVK